MSQFHRPSVSLKAVASVVLSTAILQAPSAFSAEDKEEKKHYLDPTKIVTKVGVGYNDSFSLSGSMQMDSVRKINARINDDASEWRLGGSWLFDVGIINFNFSRSSYDDGGNKKDYSIGSYAPLSRYDFTPWGWQPFIQGGYSYKTGEIRQKSLEINPGADQMFVDSTSNSGYLGFFAFKPLNKQWSLMSFAGGSAGSDDYRGHWFGIGAGYKPVEGHSFNSYAYVSDNNFGRNEKIGFSYTYEFK